MSHRLAVYAVENDEDRQEISVVRVQAMTDMAVFAARGLLKCRSSRNLSEFKLTVKLVLITIQVCDKCGSCSLFPVPCYVE